MKCKQCGFDNRVGVKFCENCGESLVEKKGIFCQNCGHKNRPGVSYCEECGAALSAEMTPAFAAAMPAGGAVPNVVVVEQPGKKKLVNLLWLVILLLLLLITCCCLLLLYERIELPEAIRPIVGPVINKVREALPLPAIPGGQDGGEVVIEDQAAGNEKGKPSTCEDFRTQLKTADLGADTMCFNTRDECYVDIENIDFYNGLEIDIQWQGSDRQQASCKQMIDANDGFIRCTFPRVKNSDRVDYWILLDECEEDLGFSDGWLESLPQAPPPESPSSKPASCCATVLPEQPVYVRIPPPNGPLFLAFGAQCAEGWNFTPNTCATFDAYVGANRDIFWTSGECCPDPESPNKFLGCEANIQEAGQKKSATQIKLRYGECYWEFEFQSPYYAPPVEGPTGDCPSGQAMCYGSCCSQGHCCCISDQGCGCWESCPS